MVVSLEGEYAPGLQAGAGPVELTIPRQSARARRELTSAFEIERPTGAEISRAQIALVIAGAATLLGSTRPGD
jgi:hypothetical protein